MHTLPLGALIFYNSSSDNVHYDEGRDTTAKVFFCISLAMNLIEMIIFQLSMGTNLDLDARTGKPLIESSTIRLICYASIFLAIGSVSTGLRAFDDQGCPDRWFEDSGDLDKVCQDCSVYFGAECLACSSTACETCESGFFFVTQDQNYTSAGLFIEAATETRCRQCT